MPDLNTSQERRQHRRIVERIIITGTLRLETPAHFGNGEADAFTDMPLLKDELERDKPLLPGTSIAGALRNYLRERELGDYFPAPAPPKEENNESEAKRREKRERYLQQQGCAARLLFGAYRSDDEGRQSLLIVRDALGIATDYELRDGVRIEPETRTAGDQKKYDTMLLAAGSTFDLRLELLICQPEEDDEDLRMLLRLPQSEPVILAAYRAALLNAVVTVLDGLASGEITLGARKRRGFGRCKVDSWTVCHYDLLQRADLLAWLAEDHSAWASPVTPKTSRSIAEALSFTGQPLDDARKRFTINAMFVIDGSLMVRSGLADSSTDMIHLHSPRPNQSGGMTPRPILAGTSWAGALRSRATQIAYTLAPLEKRNDGDDKVSALIDRIFGPAEIEARNGRTNGSKGRKQREREPRASRVTVAESEIRGGRALEPTRIKIDRFTGGAFESALFSEQPWFSNQDAKLTLELALRLPPTLSRDEQQAEIGLPLLLLKDLWTGDLPLGGEVGIGRGRLCGREAKIGHDGRRWKMEKTDAGKIALSEIIKDAQGNETTIEADRAELQGFVEMLKEELRYA